ncbi:MAG: class I SAM-dependent methyltransferase [Dehalococcoidia bacterium]|nr:class I SAM-dependent methyltransferase [Dehalococcoidia bacterium]
MTALKILLIVILCILAFPILWLSLAKLIRKLVHFPAPAFIGRGLDSNYRRKLQPPDKIIRRSGIKEGMHVLDLGCGSGAFTPSVARAVGERGKMYALDIQPKMLKQLRNKLFRPENKDIKNIKLIEGNAYELPFDNGSLDLVYMVTVLQEISDRNKALQQVRRVLKPGGFLAVTELFPDPDYPWKSTTIKLGEGAGFVVDEMSGNFFNYTVRFKKP